MKNPSMKHLNVKTETFSDLIEICDQLNAENDELLTLLENITDALVEQSRLADAKELIMRRKIDKMEAEQECTRDMLHKLYKAYCGEDFPSHEEFEIVEGLMEEWRFIPARPKNDGIDLRPMPKGDTPF